MINRKGKIKMETVYIAGGCLWGVQHFFDTVPGVQMTEAGRANGTTSSLDGPYDGYAAVSYTHLDVYKRQRRDGSLKNTI